VLDGEVAVPCNLQPAIAGLKSNPRLVLVGSWSEQVMRMVWSYATRTHEPCQIRKEAAVSGHFCVP